MPKDRVWVGLDLGEQQINVCVLNDAGDPLFEGACLCEARDVEAALVAFPPPAIGLIGVEAGTSTRIVRALRSRGYPVAIFEARKASKFLAIRRSKTDASDAHGLADLARLGRHTVSQVHLKSLELEQLRAELGLRHKLIKMRVAVECSLRSRLLGFGLRLKAPRSAVVLRNNINLAIASLGKNEGSALSAHIEPLLKVAEGLRSYLKTIDRILEKRANEIPVCKRFMEIPGVGWVCALSFYTAIENPDRFSRPEDVGAYLGLVPRRYQSGSVSKTLGITKTGSKLTRQHLVTAAMVMRSRKMDCALRDWGLLLKERLGPGRSRVAMARKLAVLMLRIRKSGERFAPYPESRSKRPEFGALHVSKDASSG